MPRPKDGLAVAHTSGARERSVRLALVLRPLDPEASRPDYLGDSELCTFDRSLSGQHEEEHDREGWPLAQITNYANLVQFAVQTFVNPSRPTQRLDRGGQRSLNMFDCLLGDCGPVAVMMIRAAA